MSDGTSPRAVLLDTCAVIWVANGEPISRSAHAAIIRAGLADGVLVSPISAWEIGLLSRSRPGRGPAPRFIPDPKTWFARFMSGPGIKTTPFTPDVALDASFLPGDFHGDPGDRIIVATARHLGVPVVTRDSKIAAYAGAGHVRVIVCRATHGGPARRRRPTTTRAEVRGTPAATGLPPAPAVSVASSMQRVVRTREWAERVGFGAPVMRDGRVPRPLHPPPARRLCPDAA